MSRLTKERDAELDQLLNSEWSDSDAGAFAAAALELHDEVVALRGELAAAIEQYDAMKDSRDAAQLDGLYQMQLREELYGKLRAEESARRLLLDECSSLRDAIADALSERDAAKAENGVLRDNLILAKRDAEARYVESVNLRADRDVIKARVAELNGTLNSIALCDEQPGGCECSDMAQDFIDKAELAAVAKEPK